MPKIKVAAFNATAASRSGVSISVLESKAGQSIRIGLSAEAQAEFFGGPLTPGTDALEVELTDDPGAVHLFGLKLSAEGDPDALPISGSIKGSISLRLVPWRQLAPGNRPAVQMPVVNRRKGEMVRVKLPEWARPEPRKPGQGKSIMEA